MRGFFLLLLLFLFNHCFAQRDSISADTIIIFKTPHVIKKKIYTYDTTEVKKERIIHWGLEGYVLLDQSLIKSENSNWEFSDASGVTKGLLLTRQMDQLFAGAGIEINTAAFAATRTDIINGTEFYKYHYIKRTKIFEQQIGDTVFTQYIDSVKEATGQKNITILNHVNSRSVYSYIQIPVCVGYNFSLKKDKLYFGTVLVLRWARLLKEEGENISLRHTLWSFSPQFNLTFFITKRLSVSAKGQWSSTFGGFTDKSIVSAQIRTISYGGSLSWYF